MTRTCCFLPFHFYSILTFASADEASWAQGELLHTPGIIPHTTVFQRKPLRVYPSTLERLYDWVRNLWVKDK